MVTKSIPGVQETLDILTTDLLTQLNMGDPVGWLSILGTTCAAHEINTAPRLAAFLANIIHETGGGRVLAESLNYTPTALLKQWSSHFSSAQADAFGRTNAHPADQHSIAEHAYGGRLGNGPPGSGDGWLFRGAGLIQLTGRANFAVFAKRIGWPKPLADLPAYLQTRAGAADSAGAFWLAAGCNPPADARDIRQVREIVNGALIGIDDVEAIYAKACDLMGI